MIGRLVVGYSINQIVAFDFLEVRLPCTFNMSKRTVHVYCAFLKVEKNYGNIELRFNLF